MSRGASVEFIDLFREPDGLEYHPWEEEGATYMNGGPVSDPEIDEGSVSRVLVCIYGD